MSLSSARTREAAMEGGKKSGARIEASFYLQIIILVPVTNVADRLPSEPRGNYPKAYSPTRELLLENLW